MSHGIIVLSWLLPNTPACLHIECERDIILFCISIKFQFVLILSPGDILFVLPFYNMPEVCILDLESHTPPLCCLSEVANPQCNWLDMTSYLVPQVLYLKQCNQYAWQGRDHPHLFRKHVMWRADRHWWQRLGVWSCKQTSQSLLHEGLLSCEAIYMRIERRYLSSIRDICEGSEGLLLRRKG